MEPSSLHAPLEHAGRGFSWLPEDRIQTELQSGALVPLALRGAEERFAMLYLIYADREAAGPGTQRLVELLRARVTAAGAARVTSGRRRPGRPRPSRSC